MTILTKLSEGPKRYQDLLDGSREQLDRDIRVLCKEHKIILREGGCYELWPKQKPDNSFMERPIKQTRKCERCNEPIYRRGLKYCSNECRVADMVKPRPSCEVCGKEVTDPDNRFCSHDCHRQSMSKPRPPCAVCGVKVNRSDRKFCSVKCKVKGQVRSNGSAVRQECRRCKKQKSINLFPAACRGYARSLCYKCIREIS